MNLSNSNAIVTGGTKGIGRAIASALISAGVNVSISARHENEIKKTAAELSEIGPGRCVGSVCDVRDEAQVESFFASTVSTLGGLDILVNNAGVGIFGRPVEDTRGEHFRAVIETNVCGVFYCCHAAIPLMKQRGGGYIINISSLAGANAHANMAAYNASKFALNGFSEALMQEVRHDGIKVSYIMPGSVNTEFGGDEPSPEKSWQLQPNDIAQVVMELLQYPKRALPSRIEIRPSQPPKR
ncbi:MAG TPA: SDR family oxidoreductase [Pyrinomonadaceae bacterium]|nr:SDR family oxidoreductase [Pyrinomonadaceae bacterium]